MGLDKELNQILKDNAEKMDLVARSNWLLYMATQQQMRDRTPSSAKYGSYGFNPSGNTTVLAEWRAILPRNERRKCIKFNAINQSIYFASSEKSLDINNLIQAQKNGFTGTLPVMLMTFVGGVPFEIESTSAIYVASLTGNGSVVEQAATLNWVEEIYSDIKAIPTGEPNDVIQRPGVVSKLTTGAMQLDGDVRATYTREGVR
jgi:hypothetical protein